MILRESIPKDRLVLKNYTIVIATGNLKGAGTDANVFINLFGTKVCAHVFVNLGFFYKNINGTIREKAAYKN